MTMSQIARTNRRFPMTQASQHICWSSWIDNEIKQIRKLLFSLKCNFSLAIFIISRLAGHRDDGLDNMVARIYLFAWGHCVIYFAFALWSPRFNSIPAMDFHYQRHQETDFVSRKISISNWFCSVFLRKFYQKRIALIRNSKRRIN